MPTEKLLVRIMLEEMSGLIATLKGVSSEQYVADWDKLRAVERAFEKIGQIAKDLGENVLAEMGKELPWRNVKGIRDVLAHDYAEIDHKILWEVATGPKLKILLDAVTAYARKKGY